MAKTRTRWSPIEGFINPLGEANSLIPVIVENKIIPEENISVPSNSMDEENFFLPIFQWELPKPPSLFFDQPPIPEPLLENEMKEEAPVPMQLSALSDLQLMPPVAPSEDRVEVKLDNPLKRKRRNDTDENSAHSKTGYYVAVAKKDTLFNDKLDALHEIMIEEKADKATNLFSKITKQNRNNYKSSTAIYNYYSGNIPADLKQIYNELITIERKGNKNHRLGKFKKNHVIPLLVSLVADEISKNESFNLKTRELAIELKESALARKFNYIPSKRLFSATKNPLVSQSLFNKKLTESLQRKNKFSKAPTPTVMTFFTEYKALAQQKAVGYSPKRRKLTGI